MTLRQELKANRGRGWKGAPKLTAHGAVWNPKMPASVTSKAHAKWTTDDIHTVPGYMWPTVPHVKTLHTFASQVAPGDRRTSLLRQPKQRSFRLGRKLNCYQYVGGHGADGPVKLWRRTASGLHFEIDC